MRDLRKVREQRELRLTYPQFFAILALGGISLLLTGLLGYYVGRGATAAEQGAAEAEAAPLIPEDVETESIATLLAVAKQKQRGREERLRLDYDALLPQPDRGVPQILREPAQPSAPVPPPREVAPQEAISEQDDREAEALPETARPPAEDPVEVEAAEPAAQESVEVAKPFTIQVSSFQTAAQAQTLIGELVQRGFDAYSVEAAVNGRVWHRVRVGSFVTRDEAGAEMKRLSLMRTDLRPMVTER